MGNSVGQVQRPTVHNYGTECEDFELDYGPVWEQKFAIGLQWFTFVQSILFFLYYVYQTYKKTCGWEEFYVVTIETAKVILELRFEFNEPALVIQRNGVATPWLRYGEWLLTCPVILIHLSNITGLKDGYSKRTMRLLVSDIGTIVWGVSAALSKGWLKALFFFFGCIYASQTFFNAAKVYIESFHMVPKGICKKLVTAMAYIFFASWLMFPLCFVAGSEGAGYLTAAGSTIAHTVADGLSKNIWGIIGNQLRVEIHKHIIKYGDIRKKSKVVVAGEEIEVETYVEEEDESTEKHDTAALAHRQSFIRMRDEMESQGFQVRASLDRGLPNQYLMQEMGGGMGMMGGMNMGGMQMGGMNMGGMTMGGKAESTPIQPGRVILGLPDASMSQFLQQQWQLVAPQVELVVAIGPQGVIQTVSQAMQLGGVDFVLLHPDFLMDTTPSGVLPMLLQHGHRVVGFGWGPMSSYKELLERAQLHAYIEGPHQTMQTMNLVQLQQVILRMQAQKRGEGIGAAETQAQPPALSQLSMNSTNMQTQALASGGSMTMTMGGPGRMPGNTFNGTGMM